MFDTVKLKELQTYFEGRETFPYDDATGMPPKLKGNLTIGIGWNLSARGLPEPIINELYNIARDESVHLAMMQFPWFPDLDSVRQMVVVDMIFNMGMRKFLEFKQTIHHIAIKEYGKAADRIRASLAMGQAPRRYSILARMMETGQFPNDVI